LNINVLKFQNKILLAFFPLIMSGAPAFGQTKSNLAISLSGGFLNGNSYTNSYRGRYYHLGFDYHLAERHVLSLNYHSGGHDYFDGRFATPDDYLITPGGTNAEAFYRTFSVVYKFKLVNTRRFSLAPGLGAGLMTHTIRYPIATPRSLYFEQATWHD
jgi:hypothetical protein